MQVRRRLVIYVQGYDPRGLAEYYRMFRREFRRTCELYGLTGKIGGPQNDPKRFTTAWDVTTNGDGWQVETRYMFLRWEDIIRKDFDATGLVEDRATCTVPGRLTSLNGVVFRMLKAHWRFGLFSLYPIVLLTVWLPAGGFVGTLCMKLVASLGAPTLVANIVGTVTGLGAFASMLWLTEPQTYLLYLCDDGVSTYQFAHRERPDWEARMEAFAGEVADAVRDSKADEVDHRRPQFGFVPAVDVLDRALTRDPQLGEHGPRVRLLTVGANLPIIGFHPRGAIGSATGCGGWRSRPTSIGSITSRVTTS